MQTEKVPVGRALHLRVGEIVEVRNEAEIVPSCHLSVLARDLAGTRG